MLKKKNNQAIRFVVPPAWKRFVALIFFFFDVNREKLARFIDQADNYLPTIKCRAEFFETEITYLDASVYKGEKFINESVLGVHTHFKIQPTNSIPPRVIRWPSDW